MKSISLIILFILSVGILAAQDTLYMKNGEKINGKVLEVGTTEIKYKKAQNPDGPTYVTLKTEVALIEYKNGYKEVYNNDGTNNNGRNDNYTGNFNQRKNNGNNNTVIILPRIGWGMGWMWHSHKWWKHWCW